MDADSQSILTPELQRVMQEQAAAVTAIQVTPRQRTKEDDAVVAALLQQLDAALRQNQDAQRTLEAQSKQATEQLDKLDELRHAGQGPLAGMPPHKYRAERNKALQQKQALLRQLAHMYTRSALLCSGWLSDMVGGKGPRDAVADDTILDAVLRWYPELDAARATVKGQRTEQKQTLFRKKLMAQYDAVQSNTFAFCQVTHTAEESVVAAHIVDANVGQKTAEALFGAGEEHIWSVKNGLVLHKAYERLLDDAKAVVLPISTRPDETELHFVLLTRDLGEQSGRVWDYDALHRRRLQFRTAFRPAKRYLYFKAVLSLLRRRRACVDGNEADLETVADVGRSMWATPKPYLTNSILYRFSRELGGLSQQEANRFWGLDGTLPLERLSLADRTKADQIAVLATHAVLDEDDAALDTASAAGTAGGGKGKGKGKGKAVGDGGEESDDPFV